MLTLSLAEIRNRAQKFANEWQGETREHAEAKSFWDGFFQVFGRTRREVASFEDPVKKLEGQGKHFIDLLWKGVLMAEHKSAGKDLGKAESQAMGYIQELINSGRRVEVPRYLILSDFARIALHDLDEGKQWEIKLEDLPKNVEAFGFLAGMRQVEIKPQDPVNIEAAEKMAELHDALLEGGYPSEQLDQFLTRILFCLFAEDTQIFEANQFASFLLNETRDDGSDLGAQLAQLFSVLNTHEDKRQKTLGEHFHAFPYVNGRLFADHLPFAGTDSKMRETLLATTDLNWSRISPAIFGSMFQGVMEPKERRQVGAHYTGEPDILKVINPLFMDNLRAELAVILPLKDKKERLRRVRAFHDKIATLNFLDPACGCGNFLIIAYRELRALETEVIKHELQLTGQANQTITDIELLTRVRVSQFHGIEIGHFPAEIARVAMWLMDHQANMHLSKELGRYFLRLPLTDAANIVAGNALQIPWESVVAKDKCSFILGNPPFVGKHLMTPEQGQDVERAWGGLKGSGVLDFVTAWYRLAAQYIQGTKISVAFVSTNSITQGEQPGIYWSELFNRFKIKIHFGYRTFKWLSEARGRANVHVVIIGFGAYDRPDKKIFDAGGAVTVQNASNISPYLIEGADLAVRSRNKPLQDVPRCVYGNKPTDGGGLIIEEEDRGDFLNQNPGADKYIRPLLCAEEYLYNKARWCLWLLNATPADLRTIGGIKDRLQRVKEFRLSSPKLPTQRMANQPSLFAEIRQPTTEFMVVPQHTSENRHYVPFGYFGPENVIHNSCSAIPGATPYHFGILASGLHMAWMKQICGRLESRYRYSTQLVYNNFPWPTPTAPQKSAVERAGQAVLEARAQFPDSNLADLYDPVSMPPLLAKAHETLDRAVDKCYRATGFQSDRERVEYLFKLYEGLIANEDELLAASKTKRPKKAQKESPN
ncbi:class I SAM-dependent DNA methyltransferase [Luteolibacter yonseiensis]|uniref:site-specific DNA-methyltransferase (adenine-specific) n=2 Tax=Luteolibacter yonseiensis TaxID=1144680 RepID=A0A934QZS7_9BACT|nr:class I SAM-dependent DNA methyltransferase [Luteolibacter yonseiensis]